MSVQRDIPRRHGDTESSGGVEPRNTRNTRKGKREEVVRPLKLFIQTRNTLAEEGVEPHCSFHRVPSFSVYSVCSVVQMSSLPPCLRASVVNSPLTSWNRKAVR